MVRIWGLHGRLRRISRSRVIVQNERGEVLLVKSWVGTQTWELPGGAPRRGESPEAAARRELREEVGIDVPAGRLKAHATFYGGYEAVIFSVKTKKEPTPNRREIVGIQWADPKKLPGDTSALTRLALRKLSKKS